MNFTETEIPGVILIDVAPIRDDRGFFARGWCRDEFEKQGLHTGIVQANIGVSDSAGTLRGMHYQREPDDEVKLVQCPRGSVFDVAVDLRPDSPTFLRWYGVELSESNYSMLYVPAGCAHGYITLTDNTLLTYSTTKHYAPAAAAGVRWDDPAFAIAWPAKPKILSEADANWPLFPAANNP